MRAEAARPVRRLIAAGRLTAELGDLSAADVRIGQHANAAAGTPLHRDEALLGPGVEVALGHVEYPSNGLESCRGGHGMDCSAVIGRRTVRVPVDMDEATVTAITAELLNEHPDALDVDGDDHYWELQRTLGLLPDVGEWAVAKRAPMVFAISPEKMFTVREGGSISVESRPLDGDELIVGMASRVVSAPETPRVREATWTFR